LSRTAPRAVPTSLPSRWRAADAAPSSRSRTSARDGVQVGAHRARHHRSAYQELVHSVALLTRSSSPWHRPPLAGQPGARRRARRAGAAAGPVAAPARGRV
jgi:hypothetical protein